MSIVELATDTPYTRIFRCSWQEWGARHSSSIIPELNSIWSDDKPDIILINIDVNFRPTCGSECEAICHYGIIEDRDRTSVFTVGELIEKLKAFYPNMPVCIGDWTENCAPPNNKEASEIFLVDGKARFSDNKYMIEHWPHLLGYFVQIGDPDY